MEEPVLEARKAARSHLLGLANTDARIFCIDSDVGGLDDIFASAIPGRYFDVGIAEAHMIGAAAGVAHLGGIPFVHSFASFAIERAFEQLKVDVCYPNLGVKILATHAGLSAEHLGPTHHSICDIALARSLPNMTVLVPADSTDACRAIDQAMAVPGPVFIRLGRKPTKPLIWPANEVNLMSGRILRRGGDVTIACAGPFPTNIALEASEVLASHGIESRVLNLGCLKPIDAHSIEQAASETGRIITVEDHNVVGGLYSAICEVVARSFCCQVIPIAINDQFVDHVDSEQNMLVEAGVSASVVIKTAMSLIHGLPSPPKSRPA